MIYLDYSATTPVSYDVLESYNKATRDYMGNANSIHALGVKSKVLLNSATKQICELFNIQEEELIFTSGATESLNYIVNGFFAENLEAGDEVLITLSEHASNVLPWFRLAKTRGITIRYIELDAHLHITLNQVKKAITPHTRVISIAGITNVVGDERPIKEICEFAHQNNIFVVVDGAQSVPHMKTDVKEMDCDFLAFSAHKMCGPTGVGVLYGKYELLEGMIPVNMGGGMNESFDSVEEVYLKELPIRLEAGTQNIAGVLGLGAAIDYLEKIGLDNIKLHEIKLKQYMIEKVKNIPHIEIVNEECDSGIIAFNIEGIFAQDVAYYLNKYHICVRAGNHCAKILKQAIGVKNTVRVSLYLYNTKEEIDTLVSLLENKERIISEMI